MINVGARHDVWVRIGLGFVTWKLEAMTRFYRLLEGTSLNRLAMKPDQLQTYLFKKTILLNTSPPTPRTDPTRYKECAENPCSFVSGADPFQTTFIDEPVGLGPMRSQPFTQMYRG